MVAIMIEGYERPNLELIRKASFERDLTSEEIFAIKSRSFEPGVKMLRLARGADEYNKEEIFTDFYNTAREQDTIEDANPEILSPEVKIAEIDHFCRLENELARRKPTESINDLLLDMDPRIVPGHPKYDKNHPEYGEFTRMLMKGAMDEDERIFVEHFGRGCVFNRIRSSYKKDIKTAINACATSMAIGMKYFLKNNEIKEKKDLDYYCSYVAGDVGTHLNDIVLITDGEKLDDDLAKKFGRSLQQVNILKNIPEDWYNRKVVYLPKEYYANIPNEVLFDIKSKDGKNARENIKSVMIPDSRKALEASAEYIRSIPHRLTGYMAFAMIPYFAAVETLNSMQKVCVDKMFDKSPDAIKSIKMNPEAMVNILNFTYQITTLDGGGKRASEFMEAYKDAQTKEKYYKYSFWSDRYEKWSKDVLVA